MNKIILFFKENKTLTRILFLLFIPIIILSFINQIDILLTSFKAIIILLVFIYLSFLILKIVFPYVDIKDLYSKAVETSMGSSIVLLSLLGFLTMLIYSIFNILFK